MPYDRPLSGAVAPPSLACLRYLHDRLKNHVLPEAQDLCSDFEDLTQHVVQRVKVRKETGLLKVCCLEEPARTA